jgi:transcriptional regulator of PTS gene
MVAKPELRTGSTLLVHWGYGIGASFAHEGKVAPFAHGGFGEIGHWKLAAVSDRTCICGDTGCLETEAALWALLPEIENRFGKLPADEEGFTEFARANPLHETDGVKMALDGMIQTLHNLYQVFYPDRILLYGPFTANSAIFASLKDGLLNSIRLFMLDSVQVENVEVALHGQTIGATRHFVWDALKDYLLARWE